MSESIIGGTLPGEPVVVRAHHMHNVQMILLGLRTPEQLPENLVGSLRISIQQGDIHNESDRAYYAADVIGPDGEGAEKFLEAETEFLRTFYDLPEDHPVIISGTNDAICNGCYFGNHCQSDVLDEDNADYTYFQYFQTLGEQLGREAKYTVVTSSSEDRNRTAMGTQILTTAGTARAIIGHADFADYRSKEQEALLKVQEELTRGVRRQEHFDSAFIRANHIVYPLRRLKPLIAGYAIWAAGSAAFHVGEAVQAHHDSQKTGGHQAAVIAKESDSSFIEVPTDVLKFCVASVAYIAIPRRRIEDITRRQI